MVKKVKRSVMKASHVAVDKRLQAIDEMVKLEGERDTGAPALKLCPRCGSSDLGIRRIDIPGFAPDVQVCNRCGFRSESALEVPPIEYVEDVEEEEGNTSESRIAQIEKRLQSIMGERKGSKKSNRLHKASKPVKKKPSKKVKRVSGYAKKKKR